MKEATLTKPQAVKLLTAELGLCREWSSCLQDMDRGRQSLFGMTVRPCARMEDYRGSFRPVYRLSDIMDLIEHVKAHDADAKPESIKPTTLDLDPMLSASVRRFDRHGNPIKRKHSICLFNRSCRLHYA